MEKHSKNKQPHLCFSKNFLTNSTHSTFSEPKRTGSSCWYLRSLQMSKFSTKRKIKPGICPPKNRENDEKSPENHRKSPVRQQKERWKRAKSSQQKVYLSKSKASTKTNGRNQETLHIRGLCQQDMAFVVSLRSRSDGGGEFFDPREVVEILVERSLFQNTPCKTPKIQNKHIVFFKKKIKPKIQNKHIVSCFKKKVSKKNGEKKSFKKKTLKREKKL